MNQAKRPSGKPHSPGPKKAAPGHAKPAVKAGPKPAPAGPARDKPKTHVSTEAARRRQHQAHAASQSLDEDEL
ncbi:hypothetical protein ABTE35_18765, partial [Acinetobacter baumannii]